MPLEMKRISKVSMPEQEVDVITDVFIDGGVVHLTIQYFHPTTKQGRRIHRKPNRSSFSEKYFLPELDAYIVQEAMSDLTDNRHSHDWVE